ncbi:precorrin-3B C(17)-methyltransferase [Thermoflavimicrobium daqui]|jgi:precorrin-3B C17-methyltransferase|uniref:Precorrin-3B C(17)-methyltransferase n=1 Tax=Thermoflavimicrobium daqui TaxID=2137476 RepID=A0A364K7K8_9BACL|nr:precorrin-3B C(17)-methyltransferase [Thermoflavimicrobium daqui]RAL26286.1 precorrin-3B C(17)-methyltransferase [Thermoflavimicrobium daqui]
MRRVEISKGKLLIIGFGPGNFEHITKRAREAIQESDVIVGYKTYVDLIQDLLTDQEIVRTGMTEEVSRAQEAVRLAELGKKVAVISSGDAGVYGMAGLVYEVLIEQGWRPEGGVEVEVIPGISAINSCASLLGAPVMHDACTISLSDHLTPWETIVKRIEAAAQADFVIALYNPRSGRRTRQIVETQKILLKYRSPDTPVGLVKSAYRDRQHVVLTTLDQMLEHDIGMLTTVIIGNMSTFFYEGLMITPRGYQRKYTLDQAVQELKPHQRLQVEAEPWSLNAIEQNAENQAKESSTKLVHPAELAQEALGLLKAKGMVETSVMTDLPTRPPVSIFEVAVSPGVANKKITPDQLALIADMAGEKGEIEYTPHHQFILRVPTDEPKQIVDRLTEAGLLLSSIGDVVQLKACDFCHGDKGEAIPTAEEIHRRLDGLHVPKELKIGFNGCAMACYGAVTEEIGIVHRRGTYDLFLGGKKMGRNAHVAQRVAEGMTADEVIEAVEKVVQIYAEQAHPNERFNKFFKRVKEVAGFQYQEEKKPVIPELACGD